MRNIWVSNLDSSNMKKQERESKELSSMLQNVRKKIDEAEMNGKVYETRAQKEVK